MIKNSSNSRNNSNSSKILKKDIKHMWLENFNDTYEYVKYYFRYRFRFSNFLYISEKNSGELLSGMHLNPYKISFLNCFLKGRYVVAVATKSEYRKKGLFNKLILEAFEKYKAQSDILFLHPAVNNLYEKYLFAPSHRLVKYEVPVESFSNISELNTSCDDSCNSSNTSHLHRSHSFNLATLSNYNLQEVSFENLKTYLKVYNYFSKSFSSFIKKELVNVKNNLREITLENGKIFIIYSDYSSKKIPVGSFAYTYIDNILTIKHLFFRDEKSLISIFNFIDSFIKDKNNEKNDEKKNQKNENNKNVGEIDNRCRKIIFLTSTYYNLDNLDNLEILKNHLNLNNLLYLNKCFEKRVESTYILTRILNLESILKKTFEKHKKFSKVLASNIGKDSYNIKISDKFIESNNLTILLDIKNRVYTILPCKSINKSIEQNISINSTTNSNITGTPLSNVDSKYNLALGIDEFTSILFGEKSIKNIETQNNILKKDNVLNDFFSCERGFIHEDV